MFTAWLRTRFSRPLSSVALGAARAGLSPNAITVLGCLLSIGTGVVLASGRLRLGGLLMFPSAALDALDGAVARSGRGATPFGAYLDSLLDRVSETALLVGLAWHLTSVPGRTGEVLVAVVIAGSLLVSYARARAEGLGVECKVGLFTRVERCLLLFCFLVLDLAVPGLWVLAVGTWFTVGQRTLCVHRALCTPRRTD